MLTLGFKFSIVTLPPFSFELVNTSLQFKRPFLLLG